MTKTPGTLADVETQLRRLVNATDPHAFLIITVEGTQHFLQFSGDSTGIELDYPLATADQQSREQAFRQVCQGPDASLRESRGSDGTRFLDCDLPPNAERAAKIAEQALRELFGVADSTGLIFEGDLLPPVAA